tara:strand:+ start:42 stop:248 length:207 start_codon:yes stop_codon:yes gene_type:complete
LTLSIINVVFNIEEEVLQMTENSIEIVKVLVPDQSTKYLLKQALIQSADSASTRRNRAALLEEVQEMV